MVYAKGCLLTVAIEISASPGPACRSPRPCAVLLHGSCPAPAAVLYWPRREVKNMNPDKKIALDIAKDIVVARMENSQVRSDKDGGKDVADFFEAVYDRVLSIVKSVN